MNLLRRTILVAVIYAALMTGWAIWRETPLFDSYLLGFAFYGIVFGIVWAPLIWWMERPAREGDKT